MSALEADNRWETNYLVIITYIVGSLITKLCAIYVTFCQVIVLRDKAVLYPVLSIQSNSVQSRPASLQVCLSQQ